MVIIFAVGVRATNTRWRYYTGRLDGDHVTVTHSGDMKQLYDMVLLLFLDFVVPYPVLLR